MRNRRAEVWGDRGWGGGDMGRPLTMLPFPLPPLASIQTLAQVQPPQHPHPPGRWLPLSLALVNPAVVPRGATRRPPPSPPPHRRALPLPEVRAGAWREPPAPPAEVRPLPPPVVVPRGSVSGHKLVPGTRTVRHHHAPATQRSGFRGGRVGSSFHPTGGHENLFPECLFDDGDDDG